MVEGNYLIMERLILLGASGSIGLQSLNVISKNGGFSLVAFSIGKQYKKLHFIMKKHPEVEAFYIIDPSMVSKLSKKYPQVKIYSGETGLIDMLNNINYDSLENALVGFVGLLPTLTALKQNKLVYLANKESLVVGGELIYKLIKNGNGKLIPIDSEHVAIAKCLNVRKDGVNKIILTASGGAFRALKREECKDMKKEDALRHPTWKMGPKITIDSATMVNKTFEIIEAFYLFNKKPDDIEIIMHDKSYVHSIVSYDDGFFLADVSKPDMRNPIAWALYKGEKYASVKVTKNLKDFGKYNFFNFDIERYPLVKYAKEVMSHQGLYGATFNASNEEAVYAFLEGKIGFLDIDTVIDECMKNIKPVKSLTYETIKKCDSDTRLKAREIIKGL